MGRPDTDDDKLSKKRPRRKANGGAVMPTSIVCNPSAAATQPGAVELGVVLSAMVLLLYFFGCYETISSLPDTPKTPAFAQHMGENLNMALNRFDSKLVSSSVGASSAAAAKGLMAGGAPEVKRTTDVKIPETKWPVTLRDESDNYEDLVHPGDGKTIMKVPKFWSYPVHNGGLMSRETAMKIGSCIEPDEHGSHARGDKCPVHQRTIFIAIASYRDFQCRQTAEQAFSRAKHPERIRITVVDQIVDGEDPVCDEPLEPCDKNPEQGLCKYKNQMDVYKMDAELSVGPIFARHIGYRMYRGEYYATQSDAHVSFTQDWDADIISQLEQTHNDMAVLSTYLTDVQGSIDENGHSKRKTRPIMCNTRWEGGKQGMHLRHGAQPEKFPSIHGQPQLSPWWAAGYSFSRGHFVVNVPYDWNSAMLFQGEEASVGIRGFTIGYDFYAPERSVCFHHYAVGKNAKVRNKVHHFWENGKLYEGIGIKAMSRLLGIIHMNPETDPKTWDHTDEEIYGIGGVRTPEKFFELYGIDVVKKTAEGNLCSFVDKNGGPMHSMFTPHLRKDGMGIDYSGIDFKWVDPEAARALADRRRQIAEELKEKMERKAQEQPAQAEAAEEEEEEGDYGEGDDEGADDGAEEGGDDGEGDDGAEEEEVQ